MARKFNLQPLPPFGIELTLLLRESILNWFYFYFYLCISFLLTLVDWSEEG